MNFIILVGCAIFIFGIARDLRWLLDQWLDDHRKKQVDLMREIMFQIAPTFLLIIFMIFIAAALSTISFAIFKFLHWIYYEVFKK